MSNKTHLTSLDLAFYRESRGFYKRFEKVLIESGLVDYTRFLNKSSEFLNSGIDLGMMTKGVRYSGIFRHKRVQSLAASARAAVQHILNRWQQYINKTGAVTAKQIDREIRFLENLIPRGFIFDHVYGTDAKGYTFNLRKYLERNRKVKGKE